MTAADINFKVNNLILRPIHPDEIPHVRRVWWRLTRLGHRLPPERGLILFDRDRR